MKRSIVIRSAAVAMIAAGSIALAAPPASAKPSVGAVPDPAAVAAAAADNLVDGQPGRAPQGFRRHDDPHQGPPGHQRPAVRRLRAHLPRPARGRRRRGRGHQRRRHRAQHVGRPELGDRRWHHRDGRRRRRPSPRPRGSSPPWTSASAPRLVVLAWGTPRLAWETVVTGAKARRAEQAARLRRRAHRGGRRLVRRGPRTAPATASTYGNVTITTSGSGSSFSMSDPTRPGIRCGGQNGTTFTGTDDVWGNGSRHQPRDRLRRRALRACRRNGTCSARGWAATASTAAAAASRSGSASTRSTRSGTAATPTSAATRPTRAGHADRRGGARVRPRHLPDHARRRRQSATRTAASTSRPVTSSAR